MKIPVRDMELMDLAQWWRETLANSIPKRRDRVMNSLKVRRQLLVREQDLGSFFSESLQNLVCSHSPTVLHLARDSIDRSRLFLEFS